MLARCRRIGTSSSIWRRTSRSSSRPGSRPPGLGEQRVAECVQRAHPGPEVRAAGLQLLLGLLVVGHGQHGLPFVGPIGHQMAEALGENPRLARPGGSDDAGRARLGGPPRPAGRRRGRPPAAPAAATTVNRPRSTDSRWMTASPSTDPGGKGVRGPPSIQARRPSSSTTSPAPSAPGDATPGSRAALTPHHHTGATSGRLAS